MSKLITKDDIMKAALEATKDSKLKELFENAPMLILMVPIVADAIIKVIFKDDENTEDINKLFSANNDKEKY